jgi:hypothetical protein
MSWIKKPRARTAAPESAHTNSQNTFVVARSQRRVGVIAVRSNILWSDEYVEAEPVIFRIIVML